MLQWIDRRTKTGAKLAFTLDANSRITIGWSRPSPCICNMLQLDKMSGSHFGFTFNMYPNIPTSHRHIHLHFFHLVSLILNKLLGMYQQTEVTSLLPDGPRKSSSKKWYGSKSEPQKTADFVHVHKRISLWISWGSGVQYPILSHTHNPTPVQLRQYHGWGSWRASETGGSCDAIGKGDGCFVNLELAHLVWCSMMDCLKNTQQHASQTLDI